MNYSKKRDDELEKPNKLKQIHETDFDMRFDHIKTEIRKNRDLEIGIKEIEQLKEYRLG